MSALHRAVWKKQNEETDSECVVFAALQEALIAKRFIG